MGQRQKAKQEAKVSKSDLQNRLHPSLREKFIPIPGEGEPITDEQLAAIFGGDLKALRDVARLANREIQR